MTSDQRSAVGGAFDNSTNGQQAATGPVPYRGLGDLFTSRFKSAVASTPWLRSFVVELPDEEEEGDPNRDLIVTLDK